MVDPADRAADRAAEPPARPVAPAAGAGVRDPWFRGKWWFWLPWPPLVALDLWSKAWVFAAVEQAHPQRPNHLLREDHRQGIEVFDGIVKFELVSWGNTGTIWGLFQDGTIALMVLRCIAVVGLIWFLRQTARTARLQQFVLSLILAGALGNLYDNFMRDDRSVRDFLRFTGTWPVAWEFPAFNVADSCITVGAIALFVLLWREDRTGRQKRVS